MEALYIRKITKVGTSCGLVLPRDALAALGWGRGDYIVFGFPGGGILTARQLTPEEIKRMKPSRDIQF